MTAPIWGPSPRQVYADNSANTAANNVAALKVNRAGDTITGNLRVNGELLAAANYLRFSTTGGPGYIQWSGGGSYDLGGGGRIWHTGNLLPIHERADSCGRRRRGHGGR